MSRSHSFNHLWRAAFAAIIIVLLLCAGFEAAAQQKKRRGKPAKTTSAQQTDSNNNAATTTAATPPKPQKKNLAPLRGSDSPAGGRATITSDAPLNDYEAYRSGNRYYVVIPQANAPSAPGGLRGRGYDDVQVHKRGNDTVLSFRLKPGTTAHVNQKFNRLEVVFNSPGDASSAPGTTTSNTGTQSGTTGTTTAAGNANNSRTGTQPAVTSTQNGNAAATTGSTGANVPKPGGTPGATTSSASAIPAPTGSTPPIAIAPPETASLPSVTPALGPSVEGSPVAPSPTPSAEQIAQSRPAPSIPSAVTTTPATTGTSLGAVLRSNWLLVLIAALLLISIGLVAMARARSRRSEAGAIDKRETPALEEGALASVEAAPAREAPVVEAVAAAETVDAAVALESPNAIDETDTLEVEPVDALNVERVRLEIKHVLTGQEYDESVINTPIKETRQLIESELLFALSKRNTERRDRALAAFTEHGYFDDATRDLRTAEVPAERAAAARKLGLTRDASATPHLSAALEDTAPEVRRAAVEALAESRDPAAIGALESLLAREEDRKVPHALIQRAIRASAAAATAASTAAVQEEPPATIDVETETREEEVTVEAAPVSVEELASPAGEAAPLAVEDETPGVVEESLASVPESPVSPEATASTIEADPANVSAEDAPHVEAGIDSSPGALPIAAALVAGLATASAGAAERQRAEADAARIHAEQERLRVEQEAQRREAEEQRQRLEQERLRAEEERRRTEEEARRKEEEQQRLEQQRLEQQRAEEERQRVEAEAQREREAAEAERVRAEEERARAEEERARTEAESRRHAEEERKRVEKEARLKAFEEERQRAEEARRLRAEERERRRAEEEKARLEEQERERTEADAARRRAEEAALRLADMRRRAEEEARQREEAEAARLRKEEETRQRAEEEAARQLAEKEEAEAREREALEQERQRAAEARRLEEEERHRRLEQERLRAEEERRRTEEEARRKEEEHQRLEQQRVEEERVRVEAEAQREREAAEAERVRAEEERARAEEERARTEAESRRHAEEERKRVEEEERQRAQAEAARIQFEREADERRRREEEAAAAEATSHIELEDVESDYAEAATPVAQSELFESSVADQASFMPPLETSKGIVERDGSDWIEVDFNEPEAVGDAYSPVSGAAAVVDEAAIIEHAGTETLPVESIEEYGTHEQVKGIELATPGHGGGAYPEDDFASVPGGILRRLGSEVASERAAAVTALARVGGDDAFREISASFDDPAQLVRDAAARALFDLQADHAASFTRALREAPSDRRRRIGNALASSGLANEAIGHLMGESREKTYDAFSLLFLMSKAGEVQPLMRAIEEHPNSEVRLAVVKLLALSGQQDILPAFRRLAVRGSLPTEVRSAVMEAIYQISSQASSDTSPVA